MERMINASMHTSICPNNLPVNCRATIVTHTCNRFLTHNIIYAILNASVIRERNEKRLERNEKRLKRNETRGSKLLLGSTVQGFLVNNIEGESI